MTSNRDPMAMTDLQIKKELAALERQFADRGDHGGSPGEAVAERMWQLEAEQKRRAEHTAETTEAGDLKGGQR